MVRHHCCWVTLVLAAATPATMVAQWLPRPFVSLDPPDRALVQGTPEVRPAVAYSAIGGMAGLVAGYAIGYPLVYQPSRAADLRRGCEDCGLNGAIGTALLTALGETMGVAVGAHLGNARGGNLAADVATSFGTLLLGSMLAGGLGAGGVPAGVAVLTVPIAQIATVVAVERHTARAKAP